MKSSWRTTVAGFCTGLAMIAGELAKLLDQDPATVPSLAVVLAGLAACGLGLAARDNVVTSEQAGAARG